MADLMRYSSSPFAIGSMLLSMVLMLVSIIVVLLSPLVSAFVAPPTLLSIRYEINDNISITSHHTARVKHQLSSLNPIQYTEDDIICSKSRRYYILTNAIVVSSILLPQVGNEAYANEVSDYPIVATNTKQIAKYIVKECNSGFLRSVVRSNYNFLYRGLSPEQSKVVSGGNQPRAILLKDEPFDLLDPSTYESNDAAAYFQRLEDDMIAKGMNIKPSNSHMGTTCPKEASKWGLAASVWPIGEKGVEFAWIEVGRYFWPNSNKKQTIVTTSSTKQSQNGRGALDTALEGDTWDIMFRADNGFIVAPAALDEELKRYLQKLISI